VLPAVAPLTVDTVADVRTHALMVLDRYQKTLKEEHKRLLAIAEAAGTDEAQPGGALDQSWAMPTCFVRPTSHAASLLVENDPPSSHGMMLSRPSTGAPKGCLSDCSLAITSFGPGMLMMHRRLSS